MQSVFAFASEFFKFSQWRIVRFKGSAGLRGDHVFLHDSFFFLKKKRDSFFFINFGLIDDLVLYSHLNGLTREDMLVCKAKLNWNYEET